MRSLPGVLLVSLCILLAFPAVAGGAWPRGKGHAFAALTWSTFGDVAGYLEQVSQPVIEGPRTELTDEFGLFAEIGVTDRLTFGVDRHNRPDTGIGASIWFLHYGLADLPWNSRYAVEVGFGPVQDWRGLDDSMVRAGLAWGRGFESPWGGGWIELDGKAGWQVEAEEGHWKLDATLGLKPGERNLVYLQMQSGAIEHSPAYLRAVPTYVRRLGHGISVETALLLGVQNDDAQGVKIGTWFEF